MQNIKYFSKLLILLQFAVATSLYAFDFSQQELKSAEYPDFVINYPQSEEGEVAEYAYWYQYYFSKYQKYFEWKPKTKFQVNLFNQLGQSNGSSTPLPYNHNNIYLTRNDALDSLTDRQSYPQALVSHELAHAFHLDLVYGSPNVLRSVFGRFIFAFPALFQPAWMIEGLATYLETDHSKGFGRGASSWYPSRMRMEYLQGFIETAGDLHHRYNTFPYDVAYLYGYYFFAFIKDNFGDKRIRDWLQNYSDNLIPFRIDNNSKVSFNKSLPDLWQQYRKWLRKKFAKSYQSIKAKGIQHGEVLSDIAETQRYSQPFWASPNNLLIFSDEEKANLEFEYLSLQAKSSRKGLVKSRFNKLISQKGDPLVDGNGRYNYHPEHGLLLSSLGFCHDDAQLYDLFNYNMETGEATQLTECQRYRRGVWLNDQIVAVQLINNQPHLQLLDRDGNKQRTIHRFEVHQSIESIAVHPNQKHLILSVYDTNQGFNLYRLNLSSPTKLIPVLRNRNQNVTAQYDQHGNLYYLSDANGAFNLYRLSANQETIEQLTQTDGSIVSYAVNPFTDQAPIALAKMSPKGFNYSVLPTTHVVTINKANTLLSKSALSPLSLIPSYKTTAIYPYQPLKTLAPTSWFPIYSISQRLNILGATISSHDSFQFHQYKASLALWQNDYSSDLWTEFSYIYDNKFNLILQNKPAFSYNETFKQATINKESKLQFNHLSWFSNHFNLTIGLQSGEIRKQVFNDSANLLLNQSSNTLLVGMSLNYKGDIIQEREAFVESGGIRWKIQTDSGSPLNSPKYPGNHYEGEWQGSVSVAENILQARWFVGLNEGDAQPMKLQEIGVVANNGIEPSVAERSHTMLGLKNYSELTGDNLNLLKFSWYLAPHIFDTGFSTLPLGIGRVGLAFYYTSIQLRDSKTDFNLQASNVGLRLINEVILGYRFIMPVNIDIFKGFNEKYGDRGIRFSAGFVF